MIMIRNLDISSQRFEKLIGEASKRGGKQVLLQKAVRS